MAIQPRRLSCRGRIHASHRTADRTDPDRRRRAGLVRCALGRSAVSPAGGSGSSALTIAQGEPSHRRGAEKQAGTNEGRIICAQVPNLPLEPTKRRRRANYPTPTRNPPAAGPDGTATARPRFRDPASRRPAEPPLPRQADGTPSARSGRRNQHRCGRHDRVGWLRRTEFFVHSNPKDAEAGPTAVAVRTRNPRCWR